MKSLYDFTRGGYRIFSRQPAELKTANIQAIQYLEHLVSSTNTGVGLWDFEELFVSSKRPLTMQSNRSEINRIFFEKRTQSLAEIGSVGKVLDPAIIDRLAQRSRELKAEMVERARRDVRSAESNLQRSIEGYRSCLGSYADARTKLHSFEGGESYSFGSQITELLSENFWTYHDFDAGENVIKFLTPEIVLTEINPAAGLDLRVNLGRFVGNLGLYDFAVWIGGFERNINVNGYIHPHVASGGDICWGNITDAFTRATRARDIKKIMQLAASLLISYSAEAPYRSLIAFAEQSDTEASQDADAFEEQEIIEDVPTMEAEQSNRITASASNLTVESIRAARQLLVSQEREASVNDIPF